MNIQTKEWEKVQKLGQGGFGLVLLYQKKGTDEYIAIKRLKETVEVNDQSAKIWQRWSQEVKIMYNRIDHKNVVKAVTVPAELDSEPGDFPVLGMEYCRGGDLRRLLQRPEHCCGLRENYLLDLLHDVGSAVEYLHRKRITHRDIKPENIVLEPIDAAIGKFVYKIIDLGYAKELDSNSCFMSRVGTQQYLAPELYFKPDYTKTVDYWSFGVVVFECITGKRPFLHNEDGFDWHNKIKMKSPDDITAFYVEGGQVRFSKNLPPTNYLCSPLRSYLEKWLQLMLRWDPKFRGGGLKRMPNGVDRPKCFYVLEQILEIKIFHIYYSKTNKLLSFPVEGNHTIDNVHAAIELKMEIPIAEQTLIYGNGMTYLREQLAIEACQDSSSEIPSVFLFCENPVPEDLDKEENLPPPVRAIVKEPLTLLPLENHKEAWKNVVYYCANVNHDNKQLVRSHRAAMLGLLRLVRLVTQQKTSLNEEMCKLSALAEYFKMSLDFDLQRYDDNKMNENWNGLNGNDYQQWRSSMEEVEDVKRLLQRISVFDTETGKLINTVWETQKGQSTIGKDKNTLETCEQEAKELYEKLRSPKAGYETPAHEPMVNIVGKCVAHRWDVTKVLHKSIAAVMDSYRQLRRAMPMIEKFYREIYDKKQRLMNMQKQRQNDVWKLSDGCWSVQRMSLAETSSMSMMGTANGMMPSFQSMTSNLASLNLVDDSKQVLYRLSGLLDTMQREQDETEEYFSTVSCQ